jgi:hypothetical protein
VEMGETKFQHGRGKIGQSAAHKILMTLIVDGVPLYEIPKDPALRMFLIFFHSETTILLTDFNNADSAVEKIARLELVKIFQSVCNKDVGGLDRQGFLDLMEQGWSMIQRCYVKACESALSEQGKLAEAELDNYLKRKKIKKGNKLFPDKEIIKAKRRAASALMSVIILEMYLEVASGMDFPLTDGEIDNMWELI